jgi:amino acid adenylation domain-containing protein
VEILDFVINLKNKGLYLQEFDGNIKITGNLSALNEADKQKIKEVKSVLLNLLRSYKKEENSYQNIIKTPQQPSYPLSSSQKRLWILSQFTELSVAYNISTTYVLKGRFDKKFFQLFFESEIERHEILRTNFKENDEGEIRQFISLPEDFNFRINYIDLSRSANKWEEATQLINEENLYCFDLSAAPLFRISFYNVTEDQCILNFVIHHIISDGWSMSVLVKDLIRFREYYFNSKSLPPAPDIQYKDYAIWQNGFLKTKENEIHKAYWLNALGNELPEINLPFALKRPSERSYNGATISAKLNYHEIELFKVLCQKNGCTLFNGLLALIKTLMFKYTGNVDIIIGTPVAGRHLSRLEDQIGFYLNTLPLRTCFSADNSFTQLLKSIKSTVEGAFEHQVYPFDDLVDQLQLKRDMSRSALFDIMVILQNMDINTADGLKFGEMEMERYRDVTRTTSLFDLTFEFIETAGELELIIEYDKDVYTGSSVVGICDHLQSLLSQIIVQPDMSLKAYDILSTHEKQKLIDFNNTSMETGPERNVVEVFEKKVHDNPNNTFLIFEDIALTYGEVNDMANRCARYLIKKYNISSEQKVAIKLERSEWLVVLALAVLKTGGVFVPLDAESPGERTGYILNDCKVIACFDNEELDLFIKESALYSGEDLGLSISQNNLAYVIYTSGSTGQPKGVMVEHRNLMNIGLSWCEKYKLELFPVKLLQLANFAFDVFTGDLLRTIFSSGTLVIASPESRMDVELIYALIKKHKINIFEATPALIFPVLDYIRDNNLGLQNLKVIIFGSDNINSHSFVELCKWINNRVRIINSYGLTECTIDSSFYEYKGGEITRNIPIGKPFGNTRIYILDENLQMLPIESSGEMYIAGRGVARGYINNPALTASRFIDDPFVTNEKMYKTGDLARWLPDGNIELLGRNDDQFKIRGYRIETGEISCALLKYKDIKDVIVTAKEGSDSEMMLVAYYVSDHVIEQTELVDFLSDKLPSYMLPSVFFRIAALPITPNGKVDKKKLPEVKLNTDTPANSETKSDTEKILGEIWQNILGIKSISVNDDFFKCGGHSLKAMQLLNKINKRFGVTLKIKDVFNKTTLGKQAEFINRQSKSRYSSIPPAPFALSYPLSFSQKRLWILSQFESGSTAYNMSGAFLFKGELKLEVLNYAFNQLIKRHEILRTTFKNDDTENVRQFVMSPLDVDFEIDEKDATNITDAELRLSIAEEGLRPFDLEQGPLLRGTLYKISLNEIVLNFTIHHIISDGWSLNILIKEILIIYNSHNTQTIDLPTLKIQYKDYATWENETVKSGVLKDDKNYWIGQFSRDIPVLNLPIDKPRPSVKTYNGNILHFVFEQEELKSLIEFNKSINSTLFMSILAITNILLHKYTGQSDIIIGSASAGRSHSDLEDQVGFYIKALPLRTRFSQNDSVKKLLEEIKQLTINAYNHQIYPLDDLYEEINLQRSIGRGNLFDVMVDVQSKELDWFSQYMAKSFNGISVSEYLVHNHASSKFDLTFTFAESSDIILGSVEYNTDLFNEDTIERLIDSLRYITRCVTCNPDEKIASIVAVSPLQLNVLLEDFSNIPKPNNSEKTVIDLFEEKARMHPENIALISGTKKITYSELSEQSNKLSAHLSAVYNIKGDDVVAILLDNSEYSVIAILSVLKAGGAYVPIDPQYPEERIKYILLDCNAKLLITESNYLFRLEGFSDSVFAIDIQLDGLPVVQQTQNLAISNKLAYIIYTSGSTGMPKGVMIEHGSLFNYITWASVFYFDNNDEGSFGLYSSLAFDLTITSLFVPLIRGRSIKLIYIENRSFLDQMNDHFTDPCPDSMKLTPSHLQIILNEGYDLKKLKRIILGGEALNRSLVMEIRNQYPLLDIFNEYGPTESTVGCTAMKIDPMSDNISIGRPILNSGIFILNNELQLCPIGVYGEIYISGAGLARGYLNNPDLNKDRFISNPFYPSELMYKSGDIGKWLNNGNVEYGGRNDSQVKIRGHRIELGELENVLIQHDAVNECLALAKESNAGDKNLIAYVIGQYSDSNELKTFLSRRLPSYMIPVFFVKVESWPLTNNGKIDYKLLPDPYSSLNQNQYQAPQNELQKKLVDIWQEILQIEKIGTADDFFQLGGQSIKAINILSRVNKTFGVKISLEELFENPTVMYMAERIENLNWAFNVENDGEEYEKIKI